MSKIPNEITRAYAKEKYSMGTGSEDWKNIKSNYELEDDALAGTMSFDYSLKGVDLEKVRKFKVDLETFQSRVLEYLPKDESESKEKDTLLKKIEIGISIYSILLDPSSN